MLQAKFIEIHDTDGARDIEYLARQIWPAQYAPLIGADQVEYMLRKFQSAGVVMAQLAEGFRYFLIMAESEFVGYFSFKPDGQKCEIFLSKLYLKPEMRGKGIGRQVLEYISATARSLNLARISLTVNRKNAAAIWFYEKCGFKKIDSVVTDIGGGFVMDDLVYVRPVLDQWAKTLRDKRLLRPGFFADPFRISIFVVLVVAAGIFLSVYFPFPQVKGVVTEKINTSRPPVQITMPGTPVKIMMLGGEYVLVPVAQYSIQGVVIKKYFYWPYEAWDRLSPYNVILAWGELAKPEKAKMIHVEHNMRSHSVTCQTDDSIDEDLLSKRVSSNHIIARNNNVQAAISSIRKGDLVRLEGSLVNVLKITGFGRQEWKTSTNRNDTGVGSCEVLYVTKVTAGGKVYE